MEANVKEDKQCPKRYQLYLNISQASSKREGFIFNKQGGDWELDQCFRHRDQGNLPDFQADVPILKVKVPLSPYYGPDFDKDDSLLP